MVDARSRIVLPDLPANRDRDGGVHEGALLALLDTTGAMAAWATTGPGPYKASTPSLQAGILSPVPAGDLCAFGRLVQRDGDAFWTAVEVADATGARIALGHVLYRIVT
jgi:acyl-coenzyme A thioesterase PaaI-like protein